MQDLPAIALPLAVSLALGLLIGLERGWHARAEEEGARVAGVRTYGLLGLLGGFAGLVGGGADLVFAGLAFVALGAVLAAAYHATATARGDVGITSLIAALLTFVLGMAATLGYMAEAAAAAVIAALLLGYKATLHRWVGALEGEELRAALKLLLISVVVLPVLPDAGYGPWGALNPFEIWWMVVLIAGISFGGYFAMKIAGADRGTLLVGLFAGLASSTALTLHFARLARTGEAPGGLLAVGTLIACGTMFPRMLVVAGIVHPALVEPLLMPALAMATAVYAAAFGLWLAHARAAPRTYDAPIRNPLDLKAALVFGGLLGLIMVATAGLETVAGDAGVLGVAAASGLSDVDAITLTLASMSERTLPLGTAVLGIIIAGAANSLVKGGITLAIGGPHIGLRVAVPLAAAAAIGLALGAATLPLPDIP